MNVTLIWIIAGLIIIFSAMGMLSAAKYDYFDNELEGWGIFCGVIVFMLTVRLICFGWT